MKTEGVELAVAMEVMEVVEFDDLSRTAEKIMIQLHQLGFLALLFIGLIQQ